MNTPPLPSLWSIPITLNMRWEYFKRKVSVICTEGQIVVPHTLNHVIDSNILNAPNYPPDTCNLIVTNCQSVKSKKDSFTHLLSTTNPDFFIGTESWLTDDINNNEIFPPGYSVHRKDRSGGYGESSLAVAMHTRVLVLT